MAVDIPILAFQILKATNFVPAFFLPFNCQEVPTRSQNLLETEKMIRIKRGSASLSIWAAPKETDINTVKIFFKIQPWQKRSHMSLSIIKTINWRQARHSTFCPEDDISKNYLHGLPAYRVSDYMLLQPMLFLSQPQ